MERRAAGKKTNYEAQLRGRQPHPSVLRTLLKYTALCEKFPSQLANLCRIQVNAKALVTSPPREQVHDHSAVLVRGTKMYRTT